ncbi:MAG: DUF5312 domain-containing protein [Treponemataceae bacterium]|nr:DUF5312 domain-containing protein [Treponemataceae bacterium]
MEFKKIEAELKEIRPEIYKNTYATPNVGQAFYILYKESNRISKILKNTICSEDAAVANHFANILFQTGFKGETRRKFDNLSYDSMKQAFLEGSNKKVTREKLKLDLEDVLKSIRTEDFRKIENVMCQLDRLNDICNFRYIDLVNMFSPDFNPNLPDQTPAFISVESNKLDTYFMDLLFLISNYEITAAQGRAVVALWQSVTGKYTEEKEEEQILASLRKMAYVFNHILTKSNLQLFVQVIKQKTDINFKESTFSSNKLMSYSTRLQRQFTTTVDRIETELQDQRISEDTNALFEEHPLLELEYYNSENSSFFLDVGFPSFLWITPLRILKSFVSLFYSEQIQALLNDIVVEGFFNNPDYKTDFAQKVFAGSETMGKIKAFEDSFAKGGQFDIAVLRSWAKECSVNPELGKKLAIAIETANSNANKILKSECTVFKQLYNLIQALLEEAHKVNATDITNIKLLFNSSRNKDKVVLLEQQYPKWPFFIDIMKNYVIITTVAPDN